MPQKKRTKKTSDSSKFFFKPLGKGISAVFKITDDGGLDACKTTESGGKLVSPYRWGSALPAGSIDPGDRIDIIMLDEGFADVYAVTPAGKISTRRVGCQKDNWVCAPKWKVVHQPVDDAKPPRAATDTAPPEQDTGSNSDDDSDAVRKEAMRKRGAMLEQHATAGK